MTRQQVEWAMQHDWAISSKQVDGIWFIRVREVVRMPSGEYAEQAIEFKYFGELRAWAGY